MFFLFHFLETKKQRQKLWEKGYFNNPHQKTKNKKTKNKKQEQNENKNKPNKNKNKNTTKNPEK